MSDLPSESRAVLLPYRRAASGCRSRYQSAKNIGTLHSRQSHYLDTFLTWANLGSNPLLQGYSHKSKNDVIISYAMYLLTGQTLLAKSIRVATVKLYLKAVADYFLANEQLNLYYIAAVLCYFWPLRLSTGPCGGINGFVLAI